MYQILLETISFNASRQEKQEGTKITFVHPKHNIFIKKSLCYYWIILKPHANKIQEEKQYLVMSAIQQQNYIPSKKQPFI